ncbi:biotin transporter BioY [Mycetocola zhujimingii]|uniref:biotin transporter BioY n=1 Tax=Mycetocola zhujimingii TaxID=2079792 RepID=UPI000D3694C4|nr:biotin transporter BioY [Mycetocola zhujimingii]AWB87280.1 BioY family transporter [Mycetocola zhujimingii]
MPHNTSLRDLTRIATFTAIIAVLGLPGAIPLFGNAVPITLQTLGVMLAGAILGWWRGAASVLALLTLVAAGLPLLSGGRGGIGVFFGPSVGYLIGFVFGAAVTGLIVHAGASKPTWLRVIVGSFVGGVLTVYLFGIPLQSLVTGIPLLGTAYASLIFLPGDLVKVALSAILVMAVWRAYPRAFTFSTQPRVAAVAATP